MKNSLIKVLSFVMALTMIVGCFAAVTVSAAEHTHTKGDVVKTVPATCTATGYTVYKCKDCGGEFIADVTPKTNVHTPVDVEGSAANCDTPALAAGKKCSVCDTVISGCAPVTGSTPLGHEWKETKTPATCEANESLVHTCVRCGKTADELKAAYDKIVAEGGVKNPTYDDVAVNVKVETQGTAKTHDWDYAVKTAPTTCVDGVTVATCKNCKKVEEFAIKATHNFVAIQNADYPCVDGILKDGANGVPMACSYCGAFAENTKSKTEVKHNYVAAYGENEKLTAAMMNANFQAHGLKVGDSLNTPATCYKGGSYFGRCVCGAEKVITTEADANKHTKVWTWYVGDEKVSVNDVVAKVAAKACTDEVKKVEACSDENCKVVFNTVVVVAAGNHDMKTKVNAPTCTAEGYTGKWCTKCGEFGTEAAPTKYDYVVKLDHKYGAATVTGSCDTKLVSKKVCSVCGDVKEETLKENESHKINKGATYVVKHDPTCNAKGFYAYDCEDCDYFEKITELGEWGEKVATAHPAANLEAQGVKTAATCTAGGVSIYKCTLCNATGIEKATNAKGHTYGALGQSYKTSDGKVAVDASEKAANCKEAGREAGIVCLVCGALHPETPPKATAKNPNNHKGSVVNVKVYPATCLTDGYTYAYTSCCGYVDIPNAQDKASESKHNWEVKTFTAPTCTAEGYHYHKVCKTCGIVDLASIDLTSCNNTCGLDHTALEASKEYKIPSLGGHDFDIPAAKKNAYVIPESPETCTENGKKAYIKCENNCGAYLIDGAVVVDTVAASNDNGVDEREVALIILPHGDKYKAVVENKAATCTETGINVTADMKDANGKVCTKCFNKEASKGGYVTLANGHTIVSTVVNANTPANAANYNCTEATYTLHVCSVCNLSYADGYKAGATAHNWSALKDTTKTADDKVCIQGVREAYKCVNCSEYNYVVKTAPVAHKYSTGVAGAFVNIDLTCTKIAEFNGKTCVTCNKTVDASETPDDGTLTVKHNKVTATQDLTCTQDGFSVEYCSICDEQFSATYTKAPGHKVYKTEAEAKADIANVYSVVKCDEATDTTDGSITYVCKICMQEVTLTIPATQGLTLTIKADGAAVSNGKVAVKVAVSATAYVFNSIHFQISIDPSQIALAETENAKVDYGFAEIDAVTVFANDNGNEVDVLVYVPNGADGKAKNVSVTGTEAAFITLYFDVLPTANGAPAIAANAASLDANDKVVYIAEDGTATQKGDEVSFVVTALNTTVLGNINGDDKLDAGDAIAIQKAIVEKTYVAGADFNKDGKIDAIDFVAFKKFITSKMSVVDYLEAMGITIDAIVAEMTVRYDIDGDRTVGTDNDKAVLAAAATSYLSSVKYLDFAGNAYGSIVDVIDAIAYNIASNR